HARGAHGVARRRSRRAAGGLPRAGAARDRPSRGLDQRRLPVRARRPVLLRRALRPFSVERSRARGGVAPWSRRRLLRAGAGQRAPPGGLSSFSTRPGGDPALMATARIEARRRLEPVVVPIVKSFADHSLLTYAAAIAFQGLIALVPITLLGLGLLGATGRK